MQMRCVAHFNQHSDSRGAACVDFSPSQLGSRHGVPIRNTANVPHNDGFVYLSFPVWCLCKYSISIFVVIYTFRNN